jgi:arylsulfatase A-like enzyme
MHIIIYVLDCLRSDHLSCYGYHRQTSPNIDRLARDGVIFENACAQATWTRPSAASILTGTYPDVHRTRTINDAFSGDIATLPEVLSENGFKSYAFSAMGNVSSVLGFDRGFQRFHDLYRDPSLIKKRHTSTIEKEKLCYENKGSKVALPLAEDINDFLFPYLDKKPGTDQFLFVWSIDTHDPYAPPRETARFSDPDYEPGMDGVSAYRKVKRRVKKNTNKRDVQHLVDLYDDEICYNDYHIGRLTQKLKDLGIYDETLFIVAGDHGDAFNDYDRGRFGHGGMPYEESLRVPLICKLPRSRYAGQKIGSMVQLIDIMPTVLDYLNRFCCMHCEEAERVSGKSLIPLMTGEKQAVHEYVYSQTQVDDTLSSYCSLRSSRWKYILLERPKWSWQNIRAHPKHFLRTHFLWDREQLYDLENDRGETRNLAQQHKKLTCQFRHRLIELWASNKKKYRDISACRAEIDSHTETQLRSLGYM